jgi:hypothetical protein
MLLHVRAWRGVRSPSIVAIAPAMRLVNHQTRKIAGVYRKHCRTFPGDSAFPLSGVILTVFLIAAHWALQQTPPARRERALRRRQIKGWLTREACCSRNSLAMPIKRKVLRLCSAIDNPGHGNYTAANRLRWNALLWIWQVPCRSFLTPPLSSARLAHTEMLRIGKVRGGKTP